MPIDRLCAEEEEEESIERVNEQEEKTKKRTIDPAVTRIDNEKRNKKIGTAATSATREKRRIRL